MTIHDDNEIKNKIIDRIIYRFAQAPRFIEEGADTFIASAMRSQWGGSTEFPGCFFNWSAKGLRIEHLANGVCEQWNFTPKRVKERLKTQKQLSFSDL